MADDDKKPNAFVAAVSYRKMKRSEPDLRSCYERKANRESASG